MWYALASFLQLAIDAYWRTKKFSNQFQGQRAFNFSINQGHQQFMTDLIEEAFQININNVLITIVDIFQCLQDCLMGVAIGAKTITVRLEVRLEDWAGNFLFPLGA